MKIVKDLIEQEALLKQQTKQNARINNLAKPFSLKAKTSYALKREKHLAKK
jgi:hypothetical protein